MRATLFLHILGGALGLVSGAVALYAAKGAKLHRRSGMLFVYAMLVMALTGALIAALTSVQTSVVMGLLTAYLVFTSVSTVRPIAAQARWLHIGAALVAVALGLSCMGLGADTLARGESAREGMPAPMFFVFGSIALLAGASDIRVMRSGIQGTRRLVRHLWRMCFALFIASASFFLGQAKVIPEPIRIMPLLVVLALAPLVVLLYWLWRVRIRKTFRTMVGGQPAETRFE